MQKKIVLMHDGPGHRNTAEALPGIIEGLAKQGYKFAPLTKEVMPVVFFVSRAGRITAKNQRKSSERQPKNQGNFKENA